MSELILGELLLINVINYHKSSCERSKYVFRFWLKSNDMTTTETAIYDGEL